MPYITREDGVHFVIPSYRDVLTVKQKSQLRNDILTLSQSYGEYITLQKKGASQYEVAFSPDVGYLLGESVWSYFKKPLDMIYCEAIPNTSEAILVIVKAGSVYLDGSFPVENIPEELVIFLTQENNFEIYVYGDVPISQTPVQGKFSFEPSSVKSFNVLDKPVFPNLPLLKLYQLQLVEAVLKSQGIGVLPVRQIVMGIIVVVLAISIWEYLSKPAPPPPPPPVVNPYAGFNNILTSPAPDVEINQFIAGMNTLITLPAWNVNSIQYSSGNITASITSMGGKVEDLLAWGKNNGVTVTIRPDGVHLSMPVKLPTKRPRPTKIYSMNDVIARFADHLAAVYPGNNLTLSEIADKGAYKDVTITINVNALSPAGLDLIAQQMKDMPIMLHNISFTVDNGKLTGSIIIEALGS